MSTNRPLSFGVVHGSVLAIQLFPIYTSPLQDTVADGWGNEEHRTQIAINQELKLKLSRNGKPHKKLKTHSQTINFTIKFTIYKKKNCQKGENSPQGV